MKGSRVPQPEPPLFSRCIGEVLGTYLLVFFGCGSVHAAVLTGAQSGVWQVAIVWGVAIMIAIYCVGSLSGAHINPAITIAMAAWRGFPLNAVLPYIVSQLVGAMLAAACLLVLFGPALRAKEEQLHLKRGEPGSEVTAMCYGEYFPNPGALIGERENKHGDWETIRVKHYQRMPVLTAFLAECLGTFLLALAVFALTDPQNTGRPLDHAVPVFIGLTVAILISVIAPLTQACFNPARDMGPRTVAYIAGWGEIAVPGPNGWGMLLVYVVAPILGAVLGGGVNEGLARLRSNSV